jgi:hypothetical protein
MTTTLARATRRSLAVAAVLAGTTACSDFLNVENPNVIDVTAIDPVQDAAALANSAQQNFATAYGWMICARRGSRAGARVRDVPDPNPNSAGATSPSPAGRSAQTSGGRCRCGCVDQIVSAPAAAGETNINRGRSFVWRGFAFCRCADFCTGTVVADPDSRGSHAELGGRELRARHDLCRDSTTDAKALANAALVGRPPLICRPAEAAGRDGCGGGSPGFVFNMPYVDDPSRIEPA